jgi:hypothetical protein
MKYAREILRLAKKYRRAGHRLPLKYFSTRQQMTRADQAGTQLKRLFQSKP